MIEVRVGGEGSYQNYVESLTRTVEHLSAPPKA